MLIKVSASQNNNKFYEVSLDPSGLVTKRWGRVGYDGQTSVERSGRQGYDRVIRSKMSRGYEKVNLVDSKASVAVSADLVSAARQAIPTNPKDADVSGLVERWCLSNRHSIERRSGGLISVSDSGVVSTALGVVSVQTVAEARTILDRMSRADLPDVDDVERFLTLIPQKVGSRFPSRQDFAASDEIVRQRDLLDSLDASMAMAASMRSVSDSNDVDFRYRLTKVGSSTKKFAEVERRFERSINRSHTSSGLKLSGLYRITTGDDTEPKRWKKLADSLGNVRRLWHGTAEHNIISILHRGLFVPPSNGTYTVTGRMFGDGIYFSDQSTKALNYSQGFWAGGRRTDHCFMLLADVIMGNALRPTTSTEARRADVRGGDKYHSIYAKGGTAGVRNNEMIVWDTDQIRLSYICEFR